MSKDKGGMQTSGLHNSIICPHCDKPSARKENREGIEAYMHYTKTGVLWHMQLPDGEWKTVKRLVV